MIKNYSIEQINYLTKKVEEMTEEPTVEQLKVIRQKHLDKIKFLKGEDTSTKQGAEGVYTAINFHERAVKKLDNEIEEMEKN